MDSNCDNGRISSMVDNNYPHPPTLRDTHTYVHVRTCVCVYVCVNNSMDVVSFFPFFFSAQ